MLFDDAQLMPPRAPGKGSQARVPWYRRHLLGGVGDVAARAAAVPGVRPPRRGAIGRRFWAPWARGLGAVAALMPPIAALGSVTVGGGGAPLESRRRSIWTP